MIRAVIFSATIAALLCMYLDRPKPVKAVQVDYCVADKRVAGKDENGEWHFAWGKMYAPCDQQDIFRDI